MSAAGNRKTDVLSIFLRTDCSLPPNLALVQHLFHDEWMLVEAMTATALDVLVRRAGWHFMWVSGSDTGLGVGKTAEAAKEKAILLGLNKVKSRFNAAELGSLKVTKYPGFHVARATLQSRQIQKHTSLGLADEMSVREFPAVQAV